ncbi:MAG: hypothetical protein CMD14_05000 [Flavobacteriales bacterium]|nr:hypothetical protein [Flavobacteriales bacterium]|tara:strand:+ start:1309 stop:2190 length:882 start_codon:yes stop_codon:yes gene_type:complete
MGFKGIYKDKSTAIKVSLLFLLVFLSLALHTSLAVLLISFFADNGMAIIQNQDLTNQTSINYLKLMQLFTGVGIFITPILIYAYLTNFDFKFVSVTRQDAILVCAIMLLITPFIALLVEWNMLLPFPDWLMQFHFNSEPIITAFLNMDTIWDLLYTIFVIAIIPAIGEELFFRGYLQQTIGNWLSNHHKAILLTGFLFSAIHLDIQAIIPRFLLGVFLGYLYYWGRNLWLPILAHFTNNSLAVIFSFPLFKVENGAYSVFSKTKIDPMLALFSFCSSALLIYILYQNLSIKKD